MDTHDILWGSSHGEDDASQAHSTSSGLCALAAIPFAPLRCSHPGDQPGTATSSEATSPNACSTATPTHPRSLLSRVSITEQACLPLKGAEHPRVLQEDSSDEIVQSSAQEDPFLAGIDASIEAAPCSPAQALPAPPARIPRVWATRAYAAARQPLVCSAPLPGASVARCTLPLTAHGRADATHRISAATAAALLSGTIERRFLFVDARFRYEYDGGHIQNAAHAAVERDEALLARNVILIVYCEYSSVRGPALARRLRALDRRANRYPLLCCPEIYVLDGGYAAFVQSFPEYCTPRGYVTMRDARFQAECDQERAKRRGHRF